MRLSDIRRRLRGVCYKQRLRGRSAIFKVCVLASGSSGNSTLVATGRTRLLVDAGLSGRELSRRLVEAGEELEHLDAVLVSHEHSDHVSGLAVISRKLDICRKKSGRPPLPIFMTRLAAPTVRWEKHQPAVETFQAGARLTIGDIEIDSFTIPHDAADPVGFCFRAEGVKIGLVTDLGYIPESIKFHLRGTNLLILESNHDLDMLKVGPYPWSVKQRVMSRNGHLSNDSVSDFIDADLDRATGTLVLGHLSEHNNHPEIVRLVASQALARRGLGTKLVIAGRAKPTEVFIF
jgi:phosphoribosyl 1,2-cyclic phosphodiesterase